MLLQFYSFPRESERESSACYPSYTKIIESKHRESGRESVRDDVNIVQSKERVYFVLFYN